MKQGIKFLLPVKFDLDLNIVERIDFIFKQNKDRELRFTYPSANANRQENENIVELKWTEDDTYIFMPKSRIDMDTKVFIRGSNFNPETEIVHFEFNPTLFERVEEP